MLFGYPSILKRPRRNLTRDYTTGDPIVSADQNTMDKKSSKPLLHKDQVSALVQPLLIRVFISADYQES